MKDTHLVTHVRLDSTRHQALARYLQNLSEQRQRSLNSRENNQLKKSITKQ